MQGCTDDGVIVPARVLTDEPLHTARGPDPELADVVCRDAVEDSVNCLDAFEPWVVRGGAERVADAVCDEIQAIGCRDAQSSQEDGLDETEDRGGRANAEREGGNGGDGDGPGAPQRPDRIPQVLAEPDQRSHDDAEVNHHAK